MKCSPDDILNTVRRQQRAIHKQKQANDTIRNEITEYESQIDALKKQIELHNSDADLQKLQSLKKNLSNKYSIILADLAAEEAKRKKLQEEVSRANSRSGGLFKQSRENEEIQGRLRTMENRLDKALVRYNRNLGELADLRARIDELRKDRRNFRDVMATGATARAKKDEEMARLISESNDAYAVRDSKKMKLVQLRAVEKADVAAFEEKLSVLNQTIEAQKLTANRTVEQHTTDQPFDSQIGSQTDQQEEMTQLTELYNSTITRTLELCGMAGVPELFAEAEKLERENFSLYNYVVEHGSRVTRLQEEIDGLELQHEALVSQTRDSDEEQSGMLEKLTSDIQKAEQDLADIQQQKAANDTEFASVYTEVGEIFNLLGCSWDDAPDGKTVVTPLNSMFCLSAIETQIAEMMNNVFEKTKLECSFKDIKPLSFLPESADSASAGGAARHSAPVGSATAPRAPEKEPAGKIAEAAKPLSLDEIRRMLD
jgi:DNA repair exonuclease SbcCD ATPase subunit